MMIQHAKQGEGTGPHHAQCMAIVGFNNHLSNIQEYLKEKLRKWKFFQKGIVGIVLKAAAGTGGTQGFQWNITKYVCVWLRSFFV